MPNKQNQLQSNPSVSVEYLVIGHVTADLTTHGIRLGGTCSFSGLTAQALGMKTGLVTSYAQDLDITPIKSLWINNKISEKTSTFKNISDGIIRTQYLYHAAKRLTKDDIPRLDSPPKIVHLGPVANEVDPDIMDRFPESMKCLTPQGWMRATNADHQVIRRNWDNYEQTLSHADVAVISHEDVQMNEDLISSMANAIPVFVVTENFKGARVYWRNDARFITAPEVKYVDDTGAGDIFATAFFYRYFFTKDPWEAGRFAVMLASWSVTRKHLESIPSPEEIIKAKMELVE
jgi:hypothetical protein